MRNRQEDLTVEVTVNLLTLLVDGYGEPSLDLSTPQFLMKAVQFCIDQQEMLRLAWREIQRDKLE